MTRPKPFPEHNLWSRPQWRLALGLALLGLLAWWQLHRRPGEEGTRLRRDHLPDYVVTRFSAVETDDAGKPSRRLVADTLRHYPETDVSELERPRMELYQTDGPPWIARSQHGTVFDGGDQVRLDGNVQLDREAGAHTRAAHLETEQIDIWRKQGLAETDLAVRIRSDGDSLTANGMRLWYNEPTHSSFHGRARIRLAPETAPDDQDETPHREEKQP